MVYLPHIYAFAIRRIARRFGIQPMPPLRGKLPDSGPGLAGFPLRGLPQIPLQGVTGAIFAARNLCLAAGLAVLGGWGMAGCGYHMESLHLPGHARSLGLGPVYNRTYQGELDYRLTNQLRTRFLQEAYTDLVSPETSDLVLEVELVDFQITRYRNLTSLAGTQGGSSTGSLAAGSAPFTINFTVSGTLTLRDNRENIIRMDHIPVSGTSSLSFDAADTLETPAVKNQGVDQALADIAARIVRQVFTAY